MNVDYLSKPTDFFYAYQPELNRVKQACAKTNTLAPKYYWL